MSFLHNYSHWKPSLNRYVVGAVAMLVVVVFMLESQFLGIGSLHPDFSSVRLGNKKQSLDDIHNKTLGFQKIFAVSLPERTDHRDGLNLAGAATDIVINFVDGVHGDAVSTKALPAGDHSKLGMGTIGSWRAHMNALTEIVHNNLTTALIIEDDVDWDIRLKSLLRDFAVSSTAILQNPAAREIDFNSISPTLAAHDTPYGDSWDVLWLGHCGSKVPKEGPVVIHKDDVSVPEHQHLISWDKNEVTPMVVYPNHTRVVTIQSENVCSLAYAVTQRGARKLLYHLGLQKLEGPFDIMLRKWCEGILGNTPATCLSVLPQLFDHFRRRGNVSKDSDISSHGDKFREHASTPNIRWSVRLNMENFVEGQDTINDQYPDGTPGDRGS